LTAPLRLNWRPRETPLTAVGAAATDAASERLARRLLRHPQSLADCRLVAGGGILIVLAPFEHLPWVEGVVYLGRDDRAPSLLLPTNLAPDAPLPLVEQALLRRAGRADLPLAVLPGVSLLAFTGLARAAAAVDLEAWLEARTA
jgi:hypothetical protein